MKYFESEKPTSGRGKTKDIKWIAFTEPTSDFPDLKGTIFSDFDRVYLMPYRVTDTDVAKINAEPKTRIKSGGLEIRPSLDSKTGNVHLGAGEKKQLLFVKIIPGANIGVKIESDLVDDNPDISYNVFTDVDGVKYYTPKACYYPPIDTTEFKTEAEKAIRDMLKDIYDNLGKK